MKGMTRRLQDMMWWVRRLRNLWVGLRVVEVMVWNRVFRITSSSIKTYTMRTPTRAFDVCAMYGDMSRCYYLGWYTLDGGKMKWWGTRDLRSVLSRF